MVDKDLFLHDLSIVAILKCEGPYLKEWIDYHLLAGVDHFYLYDNESPDNQVEVAQAEIVKPYVEAGLVDYFPFPGIRMQMRAYNDAIKRFKFQSRYMSFTDADEFIYPKFNKIDLSPVVGEGIIGLVDEILSRDPNAAGLAMNWQFFGSNNLEKMDYSRGVLERFTRRAPNDWTSPGMGNNLIKTLANPRAINVYGHPHYPTYFNGLYSINESGSVVPIYSNKPITVEKIALNHYFTKTKEEFLKKIARGCASMPRPRPISEFYSFDRNEEFDDGILIYRDERAKVYQPPKPRSAEDLIKALEKNLSTDSYSGKMETFLTCRAVADYLKTKLKDDTQAKFYEEVALKAILKSFAGPVSTAEKELFNRELPELLKLPYPVVEELRKLKTD